MTANELFGEPTDEEMEEAKDHPIFAMLDQPTPSVPDMIQRMMEMASSRMVP